MKKKILSAALAGALVCSLSGSALAAGFTDTEGHWAASQISRWNGLGIISGYGEMFHPNAAITRGDMAVVLDRIMGYQAKAVNPFSDLPENAYYTSAILGANAAGVLAGDGATVRPNAPITRQEACVLVSRALDVPTANDVSGFRDAAEIAAWALPYVAGLASRGIVGGSDGKFNPGAPISRAEAVTILNNGIAALIQKEGEYDHVDTMETVVIRAADVQLKRSTVYRDVIISEGAGSGEVTLHNVTIVGNLIVRGGSKITLNNVELYGEKKIENSAVVEETHVEDNNDGSLLVPLTDGE